MRFCNSCMDPYETGDKCPKCGYADSDPVKESLHLPIGSNINDRYTVGMVLSSDSFGATYIAWDRRIGRKVVIMEYLPGEFATRVPGKTSITVFTNSKKQKQFHDGMVKLLEEAEKLRQLPADNGIAQVLDSFSHNNTAYVVTEFLEGETLSQKLKRDKIMPADDAVNLMLPVINSIQLVHSQGMIHSNICPENIFITADGKVKLINFSAYRTATTSHSRSLSAVVNSGYSAEEQYRSRSDQGSYTDVYSLGAVLYRMITGIIPPDAFERRVSFERGKGEIIKPFQKGISRNKATAIMNALNVRIEDRTKEAATLAQELTSDKKVARRGNKIRVIDNGKLKKGIIAGSSIAMCCIAAVIALFALGIIDFGDGGFGFGSLPDGKTRVPSVIGKDLAKAGEILSNSKLRPSIRDKQYSKVIPADFILLQDIKPGSIVDINTVIPLTVSGGQEMKLVPLVEGETEDNAKKILESLGFVVRTEKSPSLYKSEGIVFSQNIDANTELAVGEAITLKVSNGEVIKGVAYIETVPDLTGLTLAEATEKLFALARSGKNDGKPFGIDENVAKDYSKTMPAGCILSQNLKAGTREMTDKIFKFTISLGIHYVMMPDVQYQPLENAKEKLKLGGESQFSLSISEANDENVARGHIISQSPAGGIKVEFDSPVSLVVSLGPKEFPMPDVVSKTREDAEAELINCGITNIVYRETRDDDIPKGSIVIQNPEAGSTVTGKSDIELTVSVGKVLRTVPDIVNKSIFDGERIIREAKLTPVIFEEYNNTVAKGNIILQNPISGELETGSEVYVIVSKGRKPVDIPDVAGQEALDAERKLKGINLNVKYGSEEYDENIPEGAVKSQNPAAGNQALEGDTVTLVISRGPKPVIVPNVRNETKNAAEAALVSRRFSVNIRYVESSQADKDRVISQDPPAGTSAPRDSEVTIHVCLGIQVPDVTGSSESTARSVLSSLNLRTAVTYVESTDVPRGAVVSQTQTYEYVNRNTTITLYVSNGTRVPDVRGYDRPDAESFIQAAGLKVYIIEYESTTVPKGQVISQSPSRGTTLSAGDIVTITVSIGMKVPDVTGRSQSSAENTLGGEGFRITIHTAQSDTVPAGEVISQSPAGGSYANPGDTVTIVVSSGDGKIDVPNVTGYDQASAINILDSAGFGCVIETAYSNTVELGYVISQNPLGGARASAGSTVTITVSSGLEVPNVAGMQQSDAENILQGSSFSVIVQTEQSGTVPAGVVISQMPAGGSYANPGDTVTIIVSSGSGMVNVPNVTGFDESSAINILELAGLRYTVETAQSETVPIGIVITQMPVGGSAVNPGDTVTIIVSSGDNKVEVPDVTGYEQSSAVNILDSLGLACIIENGYSESVPPGHIISQSPDPGDRVAPNSTITLVVNSAPPAPVLSKPTILTPIRDGSLDINNPVISWNPVENAQYYLVRVIDESLNQEDGGLVFVNNVRVTETQISLAADYLGFLIEGHTYKVLIGAFADGYNEAWSQPRNFSVSTDGT